MSQAVVHVLPGTHSAEQTLLELVDRALPRQGLDPRRLSRPVRVVVPSRSLRQHVVAAIARHAGRAVLGLVVQTLASLSSEILAAAGQRPHHADPALEVLVRRQALTAPALVDVLGPLQDGLAAAVVPVADLLDAGFVADRDATALARLLQEVDDQVATSAERLRAISLVQIAGQVQQDLADLQLGRHADGHRTAAGLLRDRPDILPATAIIVYGPVDPSGAELGLIDALMRHLDATVITVAPPPLDRLMADTGLPNPQDRAVAPLLERLGSTGPLRLSTQTARAPSLRLRTAPGRRAEARGAARQIQLLLAAGAVPERIGLVVRDLNGWAHVLRPELERLGLPWSGVGGQAPSGPALRRLRALLELLARRGDCSVDRWLDALVHLPGSRGTPVELLRTALHSLGRVRVRDVARLDPGALLGAAASLPLPLRVGLLDTTGDDAGEPHDGLPHDGQPRGSAAVRQRLARGALEAAVASACWLIEALDDEGQRPLGTWATQLRRLAGEGLGWGDPDAAWRALLAALDGLIERTSPSLQLDRDETRVLLSPALEGAAAGPIGGAGGGVQVLSAIEARGRTFDHLFVLGLSRGELPRSPRSDPLLSNGLRMRMGALLPDLPVGPQRLAVERQLLAHLLTAAPHLDLSWPATDDDGRVVPPSPLVERLRLALPHPTPAALPVLGSRHDPPPSMAALPRPPAEHLRYRALHGPEDADLVATLAVALTDPPLCDAATARRLAAARVAIRQELDTPPGRLGAGPYLGFVGALGSRHDPRAGALYVTTLEAVATCGWQAFLSRLLRIESPADPAGALPGVDARLVGSVVHRVLEAVARDVLGPPPDQPELVAAAAAGVPVAAPWPTAEALGRLVEHTARAVASEEGLGLPGLWRVLARRAQPYLDVARGSDWRQGPPLVLAVEAEGAVRIDSALGPRQLRFRADRVDRDEQGRLRLTDYKTGRPLSTVKSAEKRDAALLREIARGARLQAAVYARAVPEGAIGRYLALRPDGLPADAPRREAAAPGPGLSSDDVALALDHAAGVAVTAWEEGALLPRLTTPAGDTPPACAWCDLRSACLQGDSTARLRQAAWAAQVSTPDHPHRSALALWWLGHEELAPAAAPSGEQP